MYRFGKVSGDHRIAAAPDSGSRRGKVGGSAVRGGPGRGRGWAALFASVVLLLAIAVESIIEHYAEQSARDHQRADVLGELSNLRVKLEGLISSNLFLVHGLTAVIASRPDMDVTEFNQISRNLVDNRHNLRNIAAAPDMVISMVYPIQGNEGALGLNYDLHATQQVAARRARDSGESVLAGPLTLVQGGTGAIYRVPVFLAPGPAGERPFWGLVSAVMDPETLYRGAGLQHVETSLRVAIRGKDGTGAEGPVFYGDADLFAQDPISLPIAVPGGSWRIAAIPVGGWSGAGSRLQLIRLVGLLVALIAGAMVYGLARYHQILADQTVRLRTLLNTLPDLVWSKDTSGNYLACNPRVESLLGVRESEILGKSDYAILSKGLASASRDREQEVIASGHPQTSEEWVEFAADGRKALLETTRAPVFGRQGELVGLLGIARDITERKRAEEHIRHLNRLYGVLSGINEAIVRQREPQSLFNSACRIAVDVGGFRMAWLGMVDPAKGEIQPRAHAGTVDRYLESLHINLGDDERTRGPTGSALLAGEHVVCNDIAADPRMAPWRDAALQLGYRASAAFPIRVGGAVRGAFNLYAGSRGFFDKEELRLLDELAQDIGFALELMEANRSREQSESRMRLFVDHAPAALAMFDLEMRYLSASRRWCSDFSLGAKDIIGRSHYAVFPEVTDDWKSVYRRAMAGEVVNREEDRFLRADGSEQWVRWEARPWYDNESKIGGIVLFSEEISARIEAERDSRRQKEILDQTSRLAQVGGWEMDLATGTTLFTEQTLRIYGVDSDADDVPGQITSRLAAPDRLRVEEAQRRAIEHQLAYELEMKISSPNGEPRFVHVSGEPVVVGGQVVRLVGAVQDISGRRRAEAEARRREVLLDSVFKTLPDLFFLMDPDGTIRDYRANRGGDLLLPPEDFLGKRMQDVLPADLGGQFHDRVVEVGRAGGVISFEYDLSLREGPRRFEARLSRLPEIDQLVAVVRDVTSQYRDRVALAASEARYRTLLELAPFPAVLTRLRDGLLVYGNHRAEIQYGITRDEGIGRRAEQFYEDPGQRDQLLERLRTSGNVNDFEIRMSDVQGRPFWAQVSASIVDFQGEPAIFAAINDITSRKEAEAALREQEAFFRLLAENIADLVTVLDAQGRRIYASPSYDALFGNPPPAPGDAFAAIHPQDRERVRDAFLDTVRSGKGHRIGFRHVLPNGEIRQMESQGGVIFGAQDQVERVVLVSRDVTERKRMEDEIGQLNADLEARVEQRTAELAAVNKELETFTYSVSHDLKAPLRGIDGYSRLLLSNYREKLDEEGVLFLDNIVSGAQQMGVLIEDLLAYSRMERRTLTRRDLELSREIGRVLEERRADIERLGMRVESELNELRVSADPDGLNLVLRNLVDNAIKFTRQRPEPRLTIRAQGGGESVILELSDNGIGFDMQYHDRIFEIFQRLERVEDYPGTGIGLAIVHKAMQRMGGGVRARSVPGQGATFILELPR